MIMTQSSRDMNFGEIFSENRVPIAVIGVGIAWLLANSTGLTERVGGDQRVQAARRRIGEIVFDEAVCSYNGDFVIHFNHPTWRDDPADPSTATRVKERKVR